MIGRRVEIGDRDDDTNPNTTLLYLAIRECTLNFSKEIKHTFKFVNLAPSSYTVLFRVNLMVIVQKDMKIVCYYRTL